MTEPRKTSAANPNDSTLSRLAEEVLGSCRDELSATRDLSPDQVDRLIGIATGGKKPKAADLQAILEEEGELS